MAVIYNAQGKRKQQDEQAQQPFSPSAGAAPQAQQPTATGQSVAPAAPKQAGSGGFTNLQTYLRANKAGTANLADAATKAVAGGFDTAVQGPKTESITGTSVNLADTKQAEADLAKTFDEEQYKKELASGVAGQQAAGASQSSAAGRLAAGDTSQVLSAIGGGRQGLRNLTGFGLQRDPTAQQKFQQAAVDARQRENTLAGNIADAGKRIADAKTAFTASRKQLTDNIEESNRALRHELSQAADIRTRQQAKDVADYIRMQGYGFEGQKEGAWQGSRDKIDRMADEYLASVNPDYKASMADVATQDQQQKLAALSRLGSGFDLGAKTSFAGDAAGWKNYLKQQAEAGKYRVYEAPAESAPTTPPATEHYTPRTIDPPKDLSKADAPRSTKSDKDLSKSNPKTTSKAKSKKEESSSKPIQPSGRSIKR